MPNLLLPLSSQMDAILSIAHSAISKETYRCLQPEELSKDAQDGIIWRMGPAVGVDREHSFTWLHEGRIGYDSAQGIIIAIPPSNRVLAAPLGHYFMGSRDTFPQTEWLILGNLFRSEGRIGYRSTPPSGLTVYLTPSPASLSRESLILGAQPVAAMPPASPFSTDFWLNEHRDFELIREIMGHK